MTEAPNDPGRPEPPEWDLPWERLVGRVGEVVGLELDPTEIRAIAKASGERDRPWVERLEHACTAMGLHATRSAGTVAQLIASVGPDHPVVAMDTEGHWVLFTARHGRALDAETAHAEPARMRPGELGARLAASDQGLYTWLAIDPPGLLYDAEPSPSGPGPTAPPTPWGRLRILMRQERQDIAVAFVYAVGVGVLTLATPIAVQALVNTVAFGTLLQPLAVLTFLLLIGLAFAGVLRALQAWVVEILQRRLFLRLVNDLSYRLPRVELSAFDRAHGPELVNRFFDLFTVQKAASSLLIGGLEIVLTAVVGMIVLAFYHPLLLAFDVLLLTIVAAILLGLGRGATRTAIKESKAKYEVASWLEEVARHPVAFKLAGGPSLARRRADELAATYLSRRKQHFRVVFRQLAGALALQAFASAGILGIGGWLVIERQLTLGQLVAAELIVTMIVASFAKVGKHLETSYDLVAALDKVGQLVDLPLEAPHHIAPPTDIREDVARVKVRDLAFAFDERPPIFSGLSFELQPGERLVLEGSSGAGRSVLVDVLLGLREPSAGVVEIDGVELAELDRAWLRERTALVRGRELIVGTIADNVAFGRPDVDNRRIREALRAVGLSDEVSRLPDGLKTRVMPDGAPLSTGQARRLVLARALAGRPSLLVVDGLLDSFDPATRHALARVIFAPNAPWSLLVITDDPSIRAQCNRTVALVDGQLVERGGAS